MNALLRSLLQSLPPRFILQGIQRQLTPPVLSFLKHFSVSDEAAQKAAQIAAFPGKVFSASLVWVRAPWLERPPTGETPTLTYLLQAMHFIEIALPEFRMGNSHRDLGATGEMS